MRHLQFFDNGKRSGQPIASKEDRNQKSQTIAQSGAEAPDKGKEVFDAFCIGCHSYNTRLAGPPVIEIQADYAGKQLKAVADYVLNMK